MSNISYLIIFYVPEIKATKSCDFVNAPYQKEYVPEFRLSFHFLRIRKAKSHGFFIQNALSGFRP